MLSHPKLNKMDFDLLDYFSSEEKMTILRMAAKQELSVIQVLRQSIRIYQLIVEGSHDIVEVNPTRKM